MTNFLNEDYIAAEHKYPPANILELKEAYQIHLMVPGLSKEDFKINLEEDKLSISYEKPEATATEQKVISLGFTLNSFKRSFKLNNKIDKENIEAAYENGILKITLHKNVAEEKLHKEIVIN